MPSLKEAEASNAQYSPSSLPVAVFVGGTSGIGQHMAQAFANYTKGNAHIIIVGRNEAAANSIIASFPKPRSAGWKHEFVYCDAALMKNVFDTSKSILDRVYKINFLVLSAGGIDMNGREDTEEGIDKKLALRYYSRWGFINALLPLLRKAKEQGERASVMSVLAAGWGSEVNFDDLGLKKKYSLRLVLTSTSAYNDMMMAELGRREPGISFTHIYPGAVNTPSLQPKQWALRLLMAAIIPIIAESPVNCAEYLLYALLQAKEGANYCNRRGETFELKSYAGNEESNRKLWEHSAQETGWEEYEQ